MVSLRGIKISHLYRYYKALREVSLELKAGECFALFGPNGAGKTTLMRIFSTLLRPTEGLLEVMGKNSRLYRDEARRYLFFIGHQSFLYDDLTAIENIEFAMGLRGWAPTLNEIRMILDRVGIGPFGAQKSRYLSAGMQKRLALAKALLARPHLLLLDEPYAALDEKGIVLMNQCIKEFQEKGTAVLMTSHDRVRASEVASRAGILQNKGLQEIPVSELDHALY